MAEVSGKRKAREMNGSNERLSDEQDLKVKKTNDGRRRSSFIRGIIQYSFFANCFLKI